ncbi:MAG: hypothetical protein JJV88_04780 [Sulfurovum sp.]|nr:hypothetical protein [Sulfurovaceae bacterium]
MKTKTIGSFELGLENETVYILDMPTLADSVNIPINLSVEEFNNIEDDTITYNSNLWNIGSLEDYEDFIFSEMGNITGWVGRYIEQRSGLEILETDLKETIEQQHFVPSILDITQIEVETFGFGHREEKLYIWRVEDTDTFTPSKKEILEILVEILERNDMLEADTKEILDTTMKEFKKDYGLKDDSLTYQITEDDGIFTAEDFEYRELG